MLIFAWDWHWKKKKVQRGPTSESGSPTPSFTSSHDPNSRKFLFSQCIFKGWEYNELPAFRRIVNHCHSQPSLCSICWTPLCYYRGVIVRRILSHHEWLWRSNTHLLCQFSSCISSVNKRKLIARDSDSCFSKIAAWQLTKQLKCKLVEFRFKWCGKVWSF